ncbi:MAG: asparagine synthase (glutamine-hydrolyzing) [Verrucomicrobiales bacterium]|nr:asparagine synthase (glutamine-hydrolyzing) [Verrucomicrobiales bacterium]
MCGIAGQFSPQSDPHQLADQANRALAMLRHRGPDQFGIYADASVALGNARLSIVDLDTGQQPIANEDESLWIVFNGEIFNHVELRAGLESRGHRFATHTDTEVIIHLFEEEGPGCLRHLNGQFGIAIWDKRRQRLFLARDRLGERPLFYWRSGQRLVFGSEIKALFAHPGVRAEIDPASLDQIFTFWSPLSPRSAFRDIHELPPAHYLLADQQGVEIHPYWALRFPDADPASKKPDFNETTERFRDLLVDAVQIRLRADVPIGAYLSGGLDSSAITSIIRHRSNATLHTFSIAFTDVDYDESDFQRRMAEFLGTQHHIVEANHADIARVFPDVIWHTEIPVLRTSPAPMFLLSRLVRDHKFKVVLTGEGADEILAGYDIFKESEIRRFWARQPNSRWRSGLLKRLYPEISGVSQSRGSFLTAFFRNGLTETADPAYSHAIRWRNSRRCTRFFSDQLKARIAEPGGPPVLDQVRYPEGFQRWGPLERAQFLESDIFLSQYLLSSQGDRVAMAHSVEGRLPFLDHRLVEFCSGLPSSFKLRGLTEKFILRRAMSALLPDEICKRRKRPYRAPIHRSFFGGHSHEYLEELLSDTVLKESGLFDPLAVGQLVAKARAGGPIGETDDMAVAGIISAQLCWDRFVRRFPSPEALPATADLKICWG